MKPVFLQNKMVPLLTIVSFLFLSLLLYFALKPKSQKHKLPPSPAKLPIIGNLHQLGSFPHRSLRAHSMKYGSVMFLYIGSSPILVVSSEEAAQDIMKTHDLVFSDRPSSIISDELFYRGKDVAFAPYGEYWRQVRKISVLHLLSTKRVESFRAVREEEVASMLEKISQASGPINLSKLIISTTNNTMSRIALGKYYEGKLSGGIDFQQLLAEFLILLGTIHIGDIFPSLAWMGRLTGLDARLKRNFQQWDDFLDQVIQDHNEQRNNTSEHGPQDLVDILLEVQREGSIGIPLHKDHIKAVILDNFAAGTDTTYTTIVWALAELIRHPTAMKKAQEEIRRIIHGNSIVSEDDIRKMPYLKCVIKEALRLHPPLPLLVQRKSRQDIEVKGFHIPAKTQVMVNAWAIARDPKSWTDPETFLPERFINSEVDFRGQYMKLIPFGAGRRGCPGIPFAIAAVELVLANLLHGFDWELPGEALDMSEVFGITVHKKSPLVLVPRPHYTK